MTAEVIETKRKPPLWSVKAGGRYKAGFMGADARAKAEAFAAETFGKFTVVERPPTGKELKRAEALALVEAG